MTDMTRPKFYDEEGTEKQVIGKDSDGNVEDITTENITVENLTANAIKPQSMNVNQNNLTIDSTGKLDSKANINTSEAVNCKTMKATEGINVNDKFKVDQNGNVSTNGTIKSVNSINVNDNFTVDNTGKVISKNNIETTKDINCENIIVAQRIHVNTDKFVVDQNGNARMQSLGIKDKTYQTNELDEMLLKPTSGSYTGQIRATGFTNAANAGDVTKNNTIFLTFNGVIKGTVTYFPVQQNYDHGQDIYLECCPITNPTELEEIQFQCTSISSIGIETLANVKY